VEEVLSKIRNLKYRYLEPGSLFPEEVLRYDPFSIREPLHNAIAHQDYTFGARIIVVEYEDDHLVFTNHGAFLPRSVEEVVLSDAPEERYRNPFLVEAMKNLNMIETQGGGIRKMFLNQKVRFFPMPDYDLSNQKVKVTITGKVLDMKFANILATNPDLTLKDILLLDKVQKGQPLSNEVYKYLRKNGFIEGRKPNYYLSSDVISPTQDTKLKAQYMVNRSFDDAHFMKMICEYIDKFGATSRSDIDTLIIPKLSDVLSDKQKKTKVGNLLTKLRKENKIQTVGYGLWNSVE